MRRGEGEESRKSRKHNQMAMPYLVVLRYERMDADDRHRHDEPSEQQLDLENSSGVSYRMVVDIHVCTVVSVTRNDTNTTDSYLFMWSQTRFVRGLRQVLNLDVDLDESAEPEGVVPMTSDADAVDEIRRQRFVADMRMRRVGKYPEHAIINCSNDTGSSRDDGMANGGNESKEACLVEHHRGWISYAGIGLSLATVMANAVLEWRSRRQRHMLRSKDNDDKENEQGSETNAEWQRTRTGRLKRSGGSSMQMCKMSHAPKSVQPWQ
eukprot:jgi/Picsp_1/3899/NSC_01411-R1_---NA---